MADDGEEVFELVDEEDRVVGRERRSVVHTAGLLHRAVYCWLFDGRGRLLVQRRSPGKAIGPGQWDLSCAEHLQPGEGWREVRWGVGVGVGVQLVGGAVVVVWWGV